MDNSIIDSEKLLLITDIPGFTPNISRLICMMNCARYATLECVMGLTIKELDYLHDKKSNTIGALLFHMAAVEYYYQVLTFEDRNLSEDEFKKWKAGLDLGELGRQQIKGNDLNYYIDTLNEIRSSTYKLFKGKTDEWLEKKVFWGKIEVNYYYMWFHVFEDEINHRGQISWIRKRLKDI